jgi:uncharacterized protein YjbI with pentapeptide repeats
MRQIKPQSGLLQTTPTQIGPDAFLGVAAGIGFRLGDPRILVHEATVWEAIKQAPTSAPLPAPTLPKRHAEWLMMGHSVHPCPDARPGQQVDWTCSVRLGPCTKTLSCAAAATALPGQPTIARLATDHALAARGVGAENPVGTSVHAPPLQLVGVLGISAAAVAGTGPIGTEWPTRQQWMPPRPGKVEEMARDGTHMGWPAALDRRFFQLAPPNQWSDRSTWESGAEYELRALGPGGRGCAGRLPALAPRLLCTHRGAPAALDVQTVLQTVWFLPDLDLGVMWWTGAIPGEYFDDDQVTELLLAFHGIGDVVPADALLAFGARRKSLEDHDPLLHADTLLMPPLARGWTWEIIVNSSDHPRFGLLPRSHAETCARLAANLAMLTESGQRMGDAETRQQQLAAADAALREVPPAAADTRDWHSRLARVPLEGVDDEVIRDADLGGMSFTGWHARAVRFERCRLDSTQWLDCHLEESAFVDCSFKSAKFQETVWRGSTFKGCDLSDVECRGDRAETLTLDTCRLDRFRATAGQWKQVSLIGCRGQGGALHEMRIDTLALSGTSLPDWHWRGLHADGIGLVRSHLDRLRLDDCTLDKASVVQSSLSASRWDRCQVRMGVFGAGSTLEGSRLVDCLFQASSWNELDARDIAVAHCGFSSFTAQRLNAVGSIWQHALLDGTNAMNADFAGATFEQCSMKDTMLHGANLTKTRVHRCNLVDARTGWALTSPRPAWSGNLEIGHLAIPRRQS